MLADFLHLMWRNKAFIDSDLTVFCSLTMGQESLLWLFRFHYCERLSNLLSHPSPRVSFMLKLEWQCILKAFENMSGNILKLQPLISYFVTNAFWELHTVNFQTLFFSRDRHISGILKYLCLFVSCKESEELFLFLKQIPFIGRWLAITRLFLVL